MNVQLADVFRHTENIVTRKVMDEILLIPISGEMASMDNLYSLNETAAFVWQSIDSRRTLAEVVEMLEQQYGASTEIIREDLLEVAAGFAKAELIIPVNGSCN